MAVDRKNQSYNELQHISARFNQFILDNTRDLIAIHNLSDLSYEYVNPATLKALGYEKEELLAKNAIGLVHPDDKERFLIYLKEHLHNSVRHHEEFRYQKKDGVYIWLEVTIDVIPENSSIVTISRDINRLKQDKEHQQSPGDLFYTLLEQAPVAIGIDRDGRNLFVNGAFLDLFGYESNAELLGASILNQVAPSFRDEIAEHLSLRSEGRVSPY